MKKKVKPKNQFTDSFFREKLNPNEYLIMRQKGTEAPFSGKYLYCDQKGS